jgi:Arc/MetJ-type ribon-helix-helix transcriptional regulator
MTQVKFSVTESHIHFLDDHSRFGFKDKSSMVRTALDELKKKLETQELIESAELCNQIYTEESELSDLTESALQDWPEE